MKKIAAFAILIFLLPLARAVDERINQEGRILGGLPALTNSILFNTSNADFVLSAMQIFPVTNPWNEDISRRPVLANSDAMMAQINADVGSSHRKLSLFQEMNFVLVPDNQLLVSNKFVTYASQSDFNGGKSPYGLYPTPTNLPIEGWPTQTGSQTLAQWQTNFGGDRHAIIVQPVKGLIFETWQSQLTNGNWRAANGAIFNLNTNSLRPDTWTSGDAAGFPMFPALVRFDECERGMIEHACRLVVVNSRSEHIYPATHDAGSVDGSQTNYPAMGQRLRLKAGYAIPANWTMEEKALLLGLKKYGAMVADNSSSFFSISITPDDRWGNKLGHIINGNLAITNFEVIQTTGINEGPRSTGAPLANAGPDTTSVAVGVPFQLQGALFSTNVAPITLWRAYSGPGNVTFGDATQTNTTATFSAPGIYTLELSAEDGVHAITYDAVIITVINGINVSIALNETNVNLNWTGGLPPFVVQETETFAAGLWSDIITTSASGVIIPATNTISFFRLKGQ